MKKSCPVLFASLFVIFVLSSCATTKMNSEKDFPKIPAGRFFSTVLSSGIPVEIKESLNDKKNNAFALIFEKNFDINAENSVETSKEIPKDGISTLVFECLFPDFVPELSVPAVKDGKDVHSVKVNPVFTETNDYFVFGFYCARNDFSGILQDFLSSFFTAAITEESFNLAYDLETKKLDDFNCVPQIFFDKVRKEIYASKPYSASPYLTKDSLNRIAYKDVCSALEQFRASENIKIAACGVFDEISSASMILLLERNFSRVENDNLKNDSSNQKTEEEQNGQQLKNMKSFQTDLLPQFEPVIKNKESVFNKTELIQNKHVLDNMNDRDFSMNLLLACFKCPSYNQDDYIPFALSTLVVDSIIKNSPDLMAESAVNSGCAILPGKTQIAFISSISHGNFEQAKDALKKAILYFPDKSTLERTLNVYKRHYINKLVSSCEYSEKEIYSLIASWIYSGDAKEYTKRALKVNSVKSWEVISAYEKYFVNSSMQWFVLN